MSYSKIKKSYLFLFVIISFILAISPINALADKPKSKIYNNNLITFLVSPDDTQIYSIHSQTKEGDETRVLMISDMATGKVIKKIPIPLISSFSWFKPKLAITPDGTKLYIVDIDKIVYLVDIKKNNVVQVENKPKQDVGSEIGSSIIAAPDGRHLYVADGAAQLHSPAVIHTVDTFSNRVIAIAKSTNGGWFDGVMALNKDTSLLYISRRVGRYDGDLSIFDTRTNNLEDGVIKVGQVIEAMAMNPRNGKLYVSQKDHIDVIDPKSRKVIDVIEVDCDIVGMTFALNGTKLYLLDTNHVSKDMIRVVDTLTKKVHTLSLFTTDKSEIQTSADGKRVYVGEVLRNTFTIIDAGTDSIVRELKLIV
ncbi:MAG: YncE family protein [Gammaproteobacteria bacterium]